jgi:malonate transporter
MLDTIFSIAPIFVLIVLGHLLRRGGIPSFEFWNLNDKLVYWVMFPALLFYKMSTLEISTELIGSYAVVILGGFLGAVLFSLLSAKVLKLNSPAASSLLQGSVRHNTFIALAVAERLFGAEGLALAALATALLIPTTNLTVVPLMTWLLRKPGDRGVLKAILQDLSRNPLLLAVGLGILANVSEVGRIPIVHEVAEILGGAALPVILLCVGANIRVRAMATSAIPTIASMIVKLILWPVLIVVLAQLMDLSETATMVALLFGAVPTAATGYTLARQMGGDAPLMAAMITLQTTLSFITLPLTLLAARTWLTF